MKDGPALSIENLTVIYGMAGGTVPAVEGVSIDVSAGEVLALVGQSGCGKSTIGLAAMQILPPSAHVSGRVRLDGVDLHNVEAATFRGSRIGMIFQEAMSSLNPVLTVARQITEGMVFHLRIKPEIARLRALKALEDVGISDPDRVMGLYPHQLSGGMRQRVMIAGVLALKPRVIIADEPSTALDIGMQRKVLDLFTRAKERDGCAILLITHDLDVVSHTADRVAVLKSGRLVEVGGTGSLFSNPREAYTRWLFAPRLSIDSAGAMKHRAGTNMVPEAESAPILRLKNISRRFGTPRRPVEALKDVSLDLWRGETLGIVGESGSGKTTLGRIVAGLDSPTAGSMSLSGEPVHNHTYLRGKRFSQCQMIFQDPASSLNPRLTVARQLAEPIVARGVRDRDIIREQSAGLLAQVGLDPDGLERFPHEFSGGQCQRIAIARALAAKPKIIVADEPISSLETAIQVEILDLLKRVGRANEIAYIFISHNIAAVAGISDTIAVMRHGRIVESAPTEQLLSSPSHPYTIETLEGVRRLENPVRWSGALRSNQSGL